MKNKNINFPKSYIIGSIFDQNYANFLNEKIKEHSLQNKVEIIYGLPISEVHYMLKNALLTFSLYHTSNLGNVFIESLQLGTPIIAINDTGSLDLIDKNAFFELKNDNINNIANVIEQLLTKPKLRNEISNNAISFSNKFIQSWEDRANFEIDLFLK